MKRTIDLLEAARLAKTKRFIFISTCAVSLGVRNIYDITKLQAEQWCEAYRPYLDDIAILRLYNVYGEGDSKSVVAKFVRAVKKGTPLVIHGTGKHTRDFIYVKDVVRAIKIVLYSDKVLNRSFEIGTGQEKSISELANTIFLISGKKVPIEYGPLPYRQLERAKVSGAGVCGEPGRIGGGPEVIAEALGVTSDETQSPTGSSNPHSRWRTEQPPSTTIGVETPIRTLKPVAEE